MAKYTKLNARFGEIHYPVTLKDMEEIILEFPKSERKFYEFAIKSLKKTMNADEKIYSFSSADPKLTKTGFMVIGEHNLYFATMKGGLMGGADVETLKYKDIKSVDFDLAPNPFGLAQMELGIIILELKGMIGSKKRSIRNIPDYNLEVIVNVLRERIQ